MMIPASLFTDGVILSRRKEIRIFGEASRGAEVRVRLHDPAGYLLAEGTGREKDGRFIVCLAPQEARTGCTLTLESGDEIRTVRDVAVGEVYLAGGQSNMELTLSGADEGPALIRQHHDPLLRFFNVPKKARCDRDQKQAVRECRWQAVEPEQGGENSAVAYFFARRLREAEPDLPVGIIGCYWGGTSITCWLEEETLRTLAEGTRYLERYAALCGRKSMRTYLKEEKLFNDTMDDWNGKVERYRQEHPGASWKEIQDVCGICPWNPPVGPGSPYRPGGLAESMLACVVPVTLTGILYYQGEEDADKTDRYDELMILLIRRWRQLFRDPALPFLFVQLPMWLDDGAQDSFLWPKLRLAQAAARDAVRNTGMVCLLDQGEYGNIHPTAKRPVGERLYELMAEMLRGGGAVSPRALSRETAGNTVTVKLSAPVVTRDGQAPRLLEIAGDDGVFVPAEGVPAGGSLRIWNHQVAHPVSVRYAWTDYSDRVNLFGENGLPLEPFLL